MDPRLDNLHDRLEAWLGTLGAADAFRPDGVTVVDVDDVAVLITTFADGGLPWVRLTAVVATDVEPTVDLLRDLLDRNVDAVTGAWRLFSDGTLAFATTLPGPGLDLDSFAACLRYVGHAAARAPSGTPTPADTAAG